jgi:hypothetical protein
LFFPGVFSICLSYLYFQYRIICIDAKGRFLSPIILSSFGILFIAVNIVQNYFTENLSLSRFLISTHLFESSPLIFLDSIFAKIVFFGLVNFLFTRISSRIFFPSLAIVAVTSLFLLTSSNTELRQNSRANCFKDVQLWIRENSNPGDTILADDLSQNGYVSWRNLTQRQFLQLEPTGSPYNYFISDIEYNKYLSEITRDTTGSDLNGQLLLQKFQERYSVDFFVTKEELNLQGVRIFCDLRVYKITSD